MMDMPRKDNGVRKRNDDNVNHQEPNMSSDWQVNGNNLTDASVGMINSIGESSSRSSAPMADSFGMPIWDQKNTGQSLGYCDVNVPNGASTSGSLGPVRADMGWTMSNALFGGGMLLPTMLHPTLPHLPADTAFIERAARFSSFGRGNFGERVNSFCVPDPLQGLGMMQGQEESFGGNDLKLLQGVEPQQHEMNLLEVSKQVSDGSPYDNEKEKGESFMRAKCGVGEADDAEFGGHCAREEPSSSPVESPEDGLGSKKRKRGEKDTDENNDTQQQSVDTAKNAVDIKQKGNQNLSKPGGKQVKQGSQGSDLPKEEYIHVRARRGQATNSHSLAERVRREKISERMKFLQDLVPGCSKVTGKAVMLDEIINYVQSLQRQVEFLSMKLATVNPRLDFNTEAFLAKDPSAGLSPSVAFPLNTTALPFSPLHLPQPRLIQSGLLGNNGTLRSPLNLQSTLLGAGYKDPTSQVPNVWEDELHNVVHMGFDSSAPLNSQDLSASMPSGQMKAQP